MTRKSRAFFVVGVLWLLANVGAVGLAAFALINLEVSYKYEVEELSPLGRPITPEVETRARWIRSDQATTSFALAFLIANVLWTSWALAGGRKGGPNEASGAA